MPGNTDPIFSRVGNISHAFVVTAASQVHDISGTIGTDIYLIWSADTTNGGWLERLLAKYAGQGTTTSNAAMLKLWRSSVNSGTPTNTNSSLIGEMILPATGTLTATTPGPEFQRVINMAFPPATPYVLGKITVSQPANFGWHITAIGGNY